MYAYVGNIFYAPMLVNDELPFSHTISFQRMKKKSTGDGDRRDCFGKLNAPSGSINTAAV